MCDMCGDNRFELIEKYKKELIESTNIESSPDEMKVLDDIMFRCWQMDWLNNNEKRVKKKPIYLLRASENDYYNCPCCNEYLFSNMQQSFCHHCGQALKWE